MPGGGGARGDIEGRDVVGGINSETARLMKISLRNMKHGWGKHTTQTKHINTRVREKGNLADPVSKKCTRVVDFFRSMVRLVY